MGYGGCQHESKYLQLQGPQDSEPASDLKEPPLACTRPEALSATALLGPLRKVGRGEMRQVGADSRGKTADHDSTRQEKPADRVALVTATVAF